MVLQKALNIEDVRRLARRRLPRGMFEFIDRGTEDEVGLRHARCLLDGVKLRPRVLVDVSDRSPEVSYFDRQRPLPIVVAPTGLAGLMWYQGEVELARAAATAGIPFCVSTQSITSVEEIADKAGGELWFQLYVLKDRSITNTFLDQARAAGVETLILTVDTAVSPKREYNTRNGFGIPFQPNLRGIADIAFHPCWLATVLGRYALHGGMPTFAHYPPEFRGKITRRSIEPRLRLADDVTWEELRELRRKWQGRLIVKGILREDDALRALGCGVDAIVVSSHGSRNLDGAVQPVNVLPRIADAVNDRMVIFADGSVRRGADVVKLLSLGARAVFVGRSILFGTAAGGQRGAERVMEILRDEIDRTMAFVGCTRLPDLGPGDIFIRFDECR